MSDNQVDPRLASFKSLTVKYSTLSRMVNRSDQDKGLVFTPAQLQHLNKRTPTNHIYERPGKGENKPVWYYITSSYVIKSLNLLFGYRWSFDVKEFTQTGGQAIVLGQLSGTLTDKDGKDFVITKTDFGRADVKISKGTSKAMDLGNDYKAATSDCLKRCYRQLGGALDVYASNEYVEIIVADDNEPTKKDKKLKAITAKAQRDLVKQRKAER